MTLYLDYKTNPYQEEEGEDSDDRWRWRGVDNQNPSDFKLLRRKSAYGHSFKHFEEEDTGENLYWVVYNIYSDGDTFSRTRGYVDPFWVGTSKEMAATMKERAKSMDYGYFGSLQETVCETMHVIERL